MSIQVKLRRGTTSQHSTFTGAEGEVTIDTDKDVVVVHDGTTVGGHPLVKATSLATVATSGDYNDLINKPTSGSGTVTSVALSAPTGFTVSGSPVTASGTLGLSFDTGYSLPTTTKQGQWDTAYSWGDHAAAGYLDSADIGVTVQGYNANTVVDAAYVHTDNNYTTAEKSKLAGIAAGAEVNVNADWNAVSGDAQILNKPTAVSAFTNDAGYLTSYTETDPIYTASSWYTTTNNSTNWNTAYSWGNHATAGYLTSYTETDPVVGAVNGLVKANGAGTISAAVAGTDYLAPSAIANMLETSDIGVTVQGYSSVLAGTTASFTTADETKLDGIEAGADVTDAANVEPLIDAHLNTSTATSGQVLGWTGTDYDWVDQSGGGGGGALTISNKTAAYTVVAGDLGTIINCTSGTFTVSLTAAATLGAGFNCWVWNTSNTATDVVTIDPSGAETIDGLTTLALSRGEGMQIVCDGVNWQTGDKKVMRGYAENFALSQVRPVASGANSLSIGVATTATATGSVAVGRNASATGNYSVAFGSGFTSNVVASSSYSTAFGNNSGGNGSQAVTGAGAMALGGSYASGTDSFAAAVANNTSSYGARGASSVALGYLANVSSNYAIAIGANASATGTNSLAIGGFQYGGPSASGVGSVVIGCNYNLSNPSAAGPGSMSLHDGSSTTSAASNSLAIQGGTARVIGQFAYGGGEVGSTAQTSIYLPKADTTNGTPKVLVNNRTTAGAAAGTNNQVILTNNSAYAFTGTVVAKQSGSTNAAAWKVEGLIVRGANAASTTLVFSTVMAISNLPLWTLALSADTTNGGLAVTATGAAATNIRWVATIQTSEVTYA